MLYEIYVVFIINSVAIDLISFSDLFNHKFKLLLSILCLLGLIILFEVYL